MNAQPVTMMHFENNLEIIAFVKKGFMQLLVKQFVSNVIPLGSIFLIKFFFIAKPAKQAIQKMTAQVVKMNILYCQFQKGNVLNVRKVKFYQLVLILAFLVMKNVEVV